MFPGMNSRAIVCLMLMLTYPACAVAQQVAADVTGIESSLQQLLEVTDRLNRDLQSADEPESPPAINQPRIDSPSKLTGPNITQTNPADENQASPMDASEIRQRLQLLRRLRSQEATPSTQNALVPKAAPPQSPIPTQPPERPQGLDAIEDNLEAKDAVELEVAPRPETDRLNADAVLSSPVNALALGQSLYRTKNYKAALKALQTASDGSLSTTDQTWVDLLIALCHRRLGDEDLAVGQLREIANAESSDYPVLLARWWLKQSERVTQFKPILNELSSDFDSLIQRSQSHVTN